MKYTIYILTLLIYSFAALASDLNLTPLLVPEINGITVVTVGPDGSSCNFNSGDTKIQDAIDSNFNEVRIVSSGTYNENIVVDDKSIIIKGGYADCSDADNGIQTTTTLITGVIAANRPLIHIVGNTQRHDIILDSLELTGGSSSVFAGGVSLLAANALLVLNNINIHDNIGRLGGGVGIVSGDVFLLATDTLITDNVGDIGGGIYCNNQQASDLMFIQISGESGISNNQAVGTNGIDTGKGGGVFLKNCPFTFYSGTPSNSVSDLKGIYANTSFAQGGGIYADTGSVVTLNGHEDCGLLGCFGDDINPVSLVNNRSNADNDSGIEDGGGVYIADNLTQLSIYAGLISGNVVNADSSIFAFFNGNGGAISVNNGATLLVERLTKECWDESNCNLFNNNFAPSVNGFGGVIYNNDSTVNIINATVHHNSASSGTLLFATGANSNTTINGGIVYANGVGGLDLVDDFYVFRSTAGAQVNIQHSTIAGNVSDTSIFGDSNSAQGTTIDSSIINDGSVDVFASSIGFGSINCTIVHEDSSIPVQMNSSVADPMFVDAVNNDYHIDSINSPAIDYCFANHSNNPDMDFETRGLDNPSVINNFGPFDIGADENQRSDVIFKDSFEN